MPNTWLSLHLHHTSTIPHWLLQTSTYIPQVIKMWQRFFSVICNHLTKSRVMLNNIGSWYKVGKHPIIELRNHKINYNNDLLLVTKKEISFFTFQTGSNVEPVGTTGSFRGEGGGSTHLRPVSTLLMHGTLTLILPTRSHGVLKYNGI
jgi:hypothetical protein